MIEIQFKSGLPIQYESFLVEKYKSYMTTCRYLEIYYPTFSFYYLKVYELGKLKDLLIFGNDRNRAKCFNLFVEIDQNILAECMKKVFEEHGHIRKIIVDFSYKKSSFKKSILYSQCNDHIISLPSKMDDYYSELGHSTRKTVKKQKSKLLRDYPTVNFVSKFGFEIDEVIIEKILKLNFERMKSKGITYGKNRDTSNIYKYSQHYGFVTYIEVDGEIIAGTISYILNKKLFGHIVGHDNSFEKYSLGITCQLIEIQKSIEMGLSTYHFLWGDNQYKRRLLAKPSSLFSYVIYRKYSPDYVFSIVNSHISKTIIRFRNSKYSKPFRDTIKSFRASTSLRLGVNVIYIDINLQQQVCDLVDCRQAVLSLAEMLC